MIHFYLKILINQIRILLPKVYAEGDKALPLDYLKKTPKIKNIGTHLNGHQHPGFITSIK